WHSPRSRRTTAGAGPSCPRQPTLAGDSPPRRSSCCARRGHNRRLPMVEAGSDLPVRRIEGFDLPRLLDREWLVTNGLGGYASGTISGASTRRYHGLLIAAHPAPLGR